MDTLGEKMKFYRKLNEMTQDDIAFKLGISTNAYSKIERNITDINYSRLVQISELFKIPVAKLLPSTDEKTDTEKDKEIIILQKKVIKLMEKIDELKKTNKK